MGSVWKRVTTTVVAGPLLMAAAWSILIPSGACALPRGAARISPADTFSFSTMGSTYVCGHIRGSWIAGRLVATNAFLPYSAEIKTTKVSLKRAKGRRKKKLKSTLSKLTKSLARSSSGCARGPNGDGRSGFPGLPGLPAPTPSAPANFDSSGNVTDTGKRVFSIPSSLNANISSGKMVWTGICTQCHTDEKNNKSFTTLKSVTAVSPMYLRLSDAELANVTAYLNRFRP